MTSYLKVTSFFTRKLLFYDVKDNRRSNYMSTIIKPEKCSIDLFFKCAQLCQNNLWLGSLNWRQKNMATRIIFENKNFERFKERIDQIK